jgi:hypothetical protein
MNGWDAVHPERKLWDTIIGKVEIECNKSKGWSSSIEYTKISVQGDKQQDNWWHSNQIKCMLFYRQPVKLVSCSIHSLFSRKVYVGMALPQLIPTEVVVDGGRDTRSPCEPWWLPQYIGTLPNDLWPVDNGSGWRGCGETRIWHAVSTPARFHE